MATHTTATNTATTFATGTTYSTRANASHVWRFLVVKRTAKFITIQDVTYGDGGEVKRVSVNTGNNGVEHALPLGNYSFAPVIRADDAL